MYKVRNARVKLTYLRWSTILEAGHHRWLDRVTHRLLEPGTDGVPKLEIILHPLPPSIRPDKLGEEETASLHR